MEIHVPPHLLQHVCHEHHLLYLPRHAAEGLCESVPCWFNVSSRERDHREQQRMAEPSTAAMLYGVERRSRGERAKLTVSKGTVF